MKALLKKELKSLFYSSWAGWLGIVFSVVLATIVWAIGSRTFVGDGITSIYPSLVRVIVLLPPLFLLLIVSFFSFSFGIDRRKYMLEKLLVNPTRFYWSKFMQPLIFVSIILLVTLSYIFTDRYVQGEINFMPIIASYISLLLVCSVFIGMCISISIFVNRAWWIILFGLLIGGAIYFALLPVGRGSDYSLKYNFEEILHGVLSSRFVVLIVNYHLITFVLVTIFLQFRQWKSYFAFVLILIAVNLGFSIMPDWEVDLFKKQYELSTYSKEPLDIAFIEGHGEVEQVYLLDAETTLARNYNIHRGEIGNAVGALDGFSTIIIVGPTEKFLEEEKQVLDQYIMQGGTVLWLLNGVYVSHTDLKAQGWSASMRNDVNVDDMLFTYGVQVKPQLIVDQLCEEVQLVSKKSDKFISVSNHFAPIIEIARDQKNILTLNLSKLSTRFMSPIDTLSVKNIRKNVLFSSSSQANVVTVPERIDFAQTYLPELNRSSIPMGVALQGQFKSTYSNAKSEDTKMIVIGGSSLITNELQGQGSDTDILPMGYNRHTKILAHNREFLLNAVNWMTNTNEPLELEIKKTLDSKKNIALPLFLFINLLLPLLLYYFLFFRGGRRTTSI